MAGTDVIIRNPMMRCFSGATEMGFTSHNSSDCLLLEGAETKVALKAWGLSAIPHTEEDLLAKLVEAGFNRDLCIATVQTMLEQKIVLRMDKDEAHDMLIPAEKSPICAHLVVCIAGTIQAGNIGHYLKALKSQFCMEMKVILTKNASKMVTAKSIRHTLACEVFTDVYDDVIGVHHVPHIWLSDWAECVIVAPATANSINRIAHSTCDDLLSLTVAATPVETPVIMVPSMNVRMWDNPGVQANLDICRQRPNYWIVEPGYGVEVNLNWDKRTLIDGAFGAATPMELVRCCENIYEIVCEKDDEE